MQNGLLVHKHLIVRAEAIKPPMEEKFLTQWLKDFIESINMKVLMGPYVKYHNVPGNRGITGAAIIETSHIVMHVWDEVNICKKIKKDFDITKIEYKFLNRETGLVDISGGLLKYNH
jgi:S-adenosylmethionine/arginine decarboxylase-like enzyme